MMTTYVLDSYALLQYFQDEPGSDKIESIFNYCNKHNNKVLLSLINWGELYYIVKRKFGDKYLQEVLQYLEQLPVKTIPVDEIVVRTASEIKAQYAISYADAFCVAIAQLYHAHIITGDPEFKLVEKLIIIEWSSKL